eukprot:3434548-Amphidinium_carterae.1
MPLPVWLARIHNHNKPCCLPGLTTTACCAALEMHHSGLCIWKLDLEFPAAGGVVMVLCLGSARLPQGVNLNLETSATHLGTQLF